MASKFNILQCDSACLTCIKKYKDKHDLKSGGEFKINCSGIPKQYVTEQMAAQLPDEDVKSMISMLDPVTWAAEVLDWHCLDPDGSIWKRKTEQGTLGEVAPYKEEYAEAVANGKSAFNRPYQAEMLRCLHGDTYVFMGDGTVKKIKDIDVGDKVITYNEGRKSTQSTYTVLNKWNNGVKDIYRLTLNNGDILKVTSNHPILAWFKTGALNKKFGCKSFKRVYVSINDGLTEGDKVYTLNKFGVFGDIQNENLGKLLGYIVSDGYVCNTGEIGTKHILQFVNIRKQYVEEFADLIKSVFNCERPEIKECDAYIGQDGVNHQKYWSVAVYNKEHPVLEFLRSIGCINKETREKSILNYAFKFAEVTLSAFINRTWAGDGCVYVRKEKHLNALRATLSLASGDQDFLELYHLLLKKIGIYKSVIYVDTKKSSTTINLVINKIEDIERFLKFTGPIFGKEDKSILALTETVQRLHNNRSGSLVTLSRTEIQSIEYIGQEEVYDIEVNTRHNFVANGIVVHNCGSKRKVFRLGRQNGKTESMVIAMLHAIFTHQNFRVIVITPYQTQIELIFGRLTQLINSKPATANSVKRCVRAPNYTLELHNGSRISGYTAGTKSGGNADAVRGQKANMLVFDEADYLSPGDMASALAVITNYPDATVWMSSTPTGAHEKFFESCYSPVYKEFYYPSMANPLWNKELEEFYRSQLTDIEYEHEILANFGEQEQGVYQGAYVEDAMMDYRYEDQVRKPGWVYCMGVDWNDTKIGTTICVVGHNESTGQFHVVTRDIVSREGWTQHAACMKIVEMNRYWQPAWIYIDKGFGSTQSEILRKFGFDALIQLSFLDKPEEIRITKLDGRLSRIVKEYDFGSKVTIKDLFTKEDREKSAKPFLVENSVRRFENRQIKFSRFDTQLEAELRGYIIDHVTVTGAPVYKQGNEKVGDHNLDAMNLALVSFTLELSSFGTPTYDNGIAFTGQFGEGANYKEKGPSATGKIPAEPKKIDTRPSMERAFPVEQSKLLGGAEIPAYHTNQSSVALWDWPGFGSDKPRPMARTSSLGNRPQPPCRKKF